MLNKFNLLVFADPCNFQPNLNPYQYVMGETPSHATVPFGVPKKSYSRHEKPTKKPYILDRAYNIKIFSGE